jgi:hypothetical protein
VIGGYTSSGYSTEVYYAPLNPNGTLGSWSSTTSLPSGRYSHTSVVYHGYLYVIGGYYYGRTSEVFFSSFQYSSSDKLHKLPSPSVEPQSCIYSESLEATVTPYYNNLVTRYTLDGSTPTITNGTLISSSGSKINISFPYVSIFKTGSFFSNLSSDIIERRYMKGNPSISSLNTTVSLPSGRASHTSVVYNGYLYVIGGSTYSNFYSTEVYYAPLNPNGTLGSWSSTTSLPSGRRFHTSVVYNGYLYVIGGSTSPIFTVPKSTTLPSIPTVPWAPGPPPPPSPPVGIPTPAWCTTATCM